MNLARAQHEIPTPHTPACVEVYGDLHPRVAVVCACPVEVERPVEAAPVAEPFRTFAQRAGIGSAVASLGAYGVMSVLTSPVAIVAVASTTMVGVCIAAWRGA